MIHVYPLNDLKEHDTGSDHTACPCNPRIEFREEILVIHNSFDGRELREWEDDE